MYVSPSMWAGHCECVCLIRVCVLLTLPQIETLPGAKEGRGAMSQPEPPTNGQRILIYKHAGLIEQILTGKKTMEIRGVHYRPGRWLLGCKGVIHASANFGPSTLIDSPLQFQRSQSRHCWPFPLSQYDKLPYKRTYAFPISNVQRMSLPFHHPMGALTVVRYRKP